MTPSRTSTSFSPLDLVDGPARRGEGCIAVRRGCRNHHGGISDDQRPDPMTNRHPGLIGRLSFLHDPGALGFGHRSIALIPKGSDLHSGVVVPDRAHECDYGTVRTIYEVRGDGSRVDWCCGQVAHSC